MLNNRDLNQVTWEMRALQGAPQFGESPHLPDVPYAAFARELGLDGAGVEDPDEVEPVRRQALAGDRPFVIDFRTDPRAADSAARHARPDRGRGRGPRRPRRPRLRQGFTAKIPDFLPGGKAGGRAGGQR